MKLRVTTALAILSSVLISTTVPAHAVDSPQASTPGTVADYTGFWSNDTGNCSLVVIDQNYALTAAHCEGGDDSPEENTIYVGADRSIPVKYKSTTVHPVADIAIVEIDSEVELPVAKLPDTAAPSIGVQGHVMGWGSRNNNSTSAYLDGQFTEFIKRDTGHAVMNINISETGRVVPGDSGGPFMVGDTVVGITSHIYMDNEGDVLPMFQSVPVSGYLDWIYSHTGVRAEPQPRSMMVLNRDISINHVLMKSEDIKDTSLPVRSGYDGSRFRDVSGVNNQLTVVLGITDSVGMSLSIPMKKRVLKLDHQRLTAY